MARKTLGFIELFWKCPSCSSENWGSYAYCTSCGSPQPKNIDFHQGSKQQLIIDPEKIKRAKAGADIHCGFCGTRNPAAATNCAQCGAELKAGSRRTAGKILGAFSEGAIQPVKCANCGTMNAGTRLKCGSCGTSLSHGAAPKAVEKPAAIAQPINRNVLFIGGAVLLLFCAAVYFLFLRTTEITGVVRSVNWQRSVAIEAFGPVELQAWRDEVPSEAAQISCSERVRTSQTEPPSSGRYDEVCGTAYTVDLGNGEAEVVQDCEYQIYDDYCSYVVNTWSPVSTAQLEGFDLNAVWPDPVLSNNQRLGEQTAEYFCVFDSDGRTYSYRTSSLDDFQRCEIGSAWILTVNAAGAVSAISPLD
jgi:hypothetical protein